MADGLSVDATPARGADGRMIAAIIQLLIVLLVLYVLFVVLKLGATAFGIPGTVVQIIGLILGLVFLLYALQAFPGQTLHWPRWGCP